LGGVLGLSFLVNYVFVERTDRQERPQVGPR